MAEKFKMKFHREISPNFHVKYHGKISWNFKNKPREIELVHLLYILVPAHDFYSSLSVGQALTKLTDRVAQCATPSLFSFSRLILRSSCKDWFCYAAWLPPQRYTSNLSHSGIFLPFQAACDGCSGALDPVCGSDQHTYQSACLAECQIHVSAVFLWMPLVFTIELHIPPDFAFAFLFFFAIKVSATIFPFPKLCMVDSRNSVCKIVLKLSRNTWKFLGYIFFLLAEMSLKNPVCTKYEELSRTWCRKARCL